MTRYGGINRLWEGGFRVKGLDESNSMILRYLSSGLFIWRWS